MKKRIKGSNGENPREDDDVHEEEEEENGSNNNTNKFCIHTWAKVSCEVSCCQRHSMCTEREPVKRSIVYYYFSSHDVWGKVVARETRKEKKMKNAKKTMFVQIMYFHQTFTLFLYVIRISYHRRLIIMSLDFGFCHFYSYGWKKNTTNPYKNICKRIKYTTHRTGIGLFFFGEQPHKQRSQRYKTKLNWFSFLFIGNMNLRRTFAICNLYSIFVLFLDYLLL